MKIKIGTIFVLLLLCLGCSKTTTPQRQRYYEIYSKPDGALIATVKDEKKVKELNKLFQKLNDLKESVRNEIIPVDAVSQYEYICYREKMEQNKEKPEFEQYATLIVYANSNYVTITSKPEILQNITLPQEILAYTFQAPDDILKKLESPGNFISG